jgi:UDP-N-acetylmuramoyl-L-alanyl-D-glutamate--2,6-diaminopimelate ligase
MLLSELLKEIDYRVIKGDIDIYVGDICYDSKKIKKDDLFVAIIGFKLDGHDYIDEVINKGSRCVIVSKDIDIINDITVIKVDDTRKILAKLSMRLFNYPQNKLKTIAVTGTKGKTTTTFMIKKILEEAGYKCGIIGTTGVYIGDTVYQVNNTTPESYEIIKYMSLMAKEKMDYMVMEVSSQALKYDRVYDIIYDYGIFTNLSEDHVGMYEHDSMEDYVKSKAKLFKQCKCGIFNIDDNYYGDMISSSNINTFGYDKKADLRAVNMKLYREGSNIGIILDVDGVVKDRFKISTPGRFSSYNAMAAILTSYLIGIDNKYIKKALCNFSVKGRVEPIYVGDDLTLLIDYAHNGISTKSVLTTIREYNPKRIVTIFGCGGNRSPIRRYEMGEIAGKYSDFCIITEDNNRYEEFSDIVRDILKGISKTKCKYKIISDRKEAIKYAIENGRKGDIIMLIGKGHEDYKEIKGVKYPFDERKIIKEILREINR